MTQAVAEQKKINNSVLSLVQDDITELDVDAFVYYAQEDLAIGTGFGTAISVRGGPTIQKELNELGPVETGQVVVSEAGKLKADAIIHAVGPRFNEADTEGKLRTTVLNCLKAADEKGFKRIALPPMGAGFYMVPLEMCDRVMVDSIKGYLEGQTNIEQAVLCAMDRREYVPFESQLASLK